MNSRKAIAFSAGLLVAGGIILTAEFWCEHQIKQGKVFVPKFVPPETVEELKSKYPDGIYPDPPPVIPRSAPLPLVQDLRDQTEQTYVPLSENSYRHIYKMKSGEVLWDIPFYLDKYKRRIVPADEKKKSSKFLAMFGDSNIVGYGLPAEKTLPNYLSQLFPGIKFYNYSGIGLYPYEILAKTTTINRTEEIPEKDGLAFYFYMSYHLRRNMGGLQELMQPWNTERHMVDLDDNGEFIEKKAFRKEMPFSFHVRAWLHRTAIFRYLELDVTPGDKDYRIQTALIKKMRKNLVSNGIEKFYVVIHPFQENLHETQTLLSYLHEEKIPFIYFGHWNMAEITPGPIHLEIDAHYSGEANQVLAMGLGKVIPNL